MNVSEGKLHICIYVCLRSLVADVSRCRLLFASVFQLQRAADAAGLLRVPANQQHREAGPHAVHPAHLPAAGGVATSCTVGQRRPLCHLQRHVSSTARGVWNSAFALTHSLDGNV